jgi:hypothetical protein
VSYAARKRITSKLLTTHLFKPTSKTVSVALISNFVGILQQLIVVSSTSSLAVCDHPSNFIINTCGVLSDGLKELSQKCKEISLKEDLEEEEDEEEEEEKEGSDEHRQLDALLKAGSPHFLLFLQQVFSLPGSTSSSLVMESALKLARLALKLEKQILQEGEGLLHLTILTLLPIVRFNSRPPFSLLSFSLSSSHSLSRLLVDSSKSA